jgi:hypothetical protein
MSLDSLFYILYGVIIVSAYFINNSIREVGDKIGDKLYRIEAEVSSINCMIEDGHNE